MQWTAERIHDVVERQRAFFESGATLGVAWRKERLKELRAAVLAHEGELVAALEADLGRSEAEAYLADVGGVVMEIDEAIAGVKK